MQPLISNSDVNPFGIRRIPQMTGSKSTVLRVHFGSLARFNKYLLPVFQQDLSTIDKILKIDDEGKLVIKQNNMDAFIKYHVGRGKTATDIANMVEALIAEAVDKLFTRVFGKSS